MLQCCGMGQGVQYDGAWVGVCGARGGGGGGGGCRTSVAEHARLQEQCSAKGTRVVNKDALEQFLLSVFGWSVCDCVCQISRPASHVATDGFSVLCGSR